MDRLDVRWIEMEGFDEDDDEMIRSGCIETCKTPMEDGKQQMVV